MVSSEDIALVGGAIMGLLIVDRISRRAFLVGSFTISALAMLLLGLKLDALMMIVLFAIFAGVLSAASNLVYVYLPELFPTAVRATGVALPYAVTVSIFGGTAESIALWFKSIGHEQWFYYYLTGMIAVSLIVYVFMRDTKKDSAMHRHE